MALVGHELIDLLCLAGFDGVVRLEVKGWVGIDG